MKYTVKQLQSPLFSVVITVSVDMVDMVDMEKLA